MDLPDEKRQVVLGSSDEKKLMLLRDHNKQTHQLPPKFYLAKFAHVMDADSPKVCDETTVLKSALEFCIHVILKKA